MLDKISVGKITSISLESICNLRDTLQVVDFNGMGSNVNCDPNRDINYARPAVMRGKLRALGLQGHIPSCLMSLPYLQSLHLSGEFLALL